VAQTSQTTAVGLANPRPCASCTLCCKLFGWPYQGKRPGQWCKDCQPGTGCAIYSDRPQDCRTYQCLWTVTEALDDRWRPDIAGFALTSHDMEVFVDVDQTKPDAWRRAPYYQQLKVWSARNSERFLIVTVRTGKATVVIFPEADIDIGAPAPGHEIESGYELKNGRPTPFARFKPIS